MPTELRVYNYEPAGITPSESADQNAVIIARQLFKGLVESDKDTGAPNLLIAESITSADNVTWTVKLKPGFRFHNGEPVIADSFIDAWTYAAYGPNEQTNRWFFGRIAGYSELQPDGEQAPAATTLSGLRKVDDLTFEVTLDSAYSGFWAMLAYVGFFPLPKVAFTDMEAFRAHPVGNGPYQLVSWRKNDAIELVRADDWGGDKPLTDRVTFRMYASLEDGYAGYVAGEHDLMDNLPAESYAEARSLFSDRVFEQASNSYTYLGIPVYRAEFQDKRVRQALSLAIDRQAIIEEIYNGQYLAASTILSPNFPGFREHPGDFCTFDPARARTLLEAAGGWQGGVLALHTNVGGGHSPWLTLVGKHLKEHLGIDCEVDESKPFSDYFQQAKDAAYTGLFRRAWAPDYAWPESYLGPILQRGGSANQQFYDNPEYDALLAKADQAGTVEEGIALYQRAEDLALEELPIIPLWFQKTSVLYGQRVTGYVRNIINGSDYAQIEVNPTP